MVWLDLTSPGAPNLTTDTTTVTLVPSAPSRPDNASGWLLGAGLVTTSHSQTQRGRGTAMNCPLPC